MQEHAIDEIKVMTTNRIVLSALYGIYAIFSVFATLVIYYTVAKPTKKARMQLRSIVEKLDNGTADLTERIEVKRIDETGQLGRGINAFISRLQKIVASIQERVKELDTVSRTVNKHIATSNQTTEDLSKITDDISYKMQEVSASMNIVSKGASEIVLASEDMEHQATSGNEFVEVVKTRATDVNRSVKQGKENTTRMIEEISNQLSLAIENSKTVNEIDALTGDILNISSQTNLLALNASIEAARAGEAGRGFAVVADEIRVLADSSKETANSIQAISKNVTNAVAELAKSAENMINYINNSVLGDYDEFDTIAEQYYNDAEQMATILNHFLENAKILKNTMEEITDSIDTVDQSIEVSSAETTTVANYATQLVEAMNAIRDEAQETRNISKKLNAEIDIFKKV